MNLLVLNCGSSTIKYKLFEANSDTPNEIAAGMVEITDGYGQAVSKLIDSLPKKPDAVAHRVVHGGEKYHGPTMITPRVLDDIRDLSRLAPLHNPPCAEGISAAMTLGVPQVAVFDTAFHQTMPPRAFRYAIPQDVYEKYRFRRYGFHGQSHRYVMGVYAQMTNNPRPTVITLHLGNGSSATAIKEGRCIDTSMGQTPLEGLVMGSRGGDMDPALVLQLLEAGMPREQVERMLWHESGLLGLAGEMDMRVLLERKDEAAKLAVEIFCYRIVKYIGAYLAALGGAQAIIFTGGIGENSAEIRSRVLSPLAVFGVTVDEEKNRANARCISTKGATLGAWVIPTNEELQIAKDALSVLE